MVPAASPSSSSDVRVGILVLNYHHPKETLDCVKSLLAREPASTRVVWLENDAKVTWPNARAVLKSSGIPYEILEAESTRLSESGVVGVILNQENLGFAGGNNVGFRLLHRNGVPFTWVLNNDTLLQSGSSNALVRAAEARPEVGLWGTTIQAADGRSYSGGLLNRRDFSIELILATEILEGNPLSFISGCSLFSRTEVAHTLGYLPEDYFLYYEDPAFSMEARRQGLAVSACHEVAIFHEESLSTGHRSPLMEYYSRRNRWAFIQRYFPSQLSVQQWKMWYRFQSLLFRGNLRRFRLEWQAMQDWKAGRMGRTERMLG